MSFHRFQFWECKMTNVSHEEKQYDFVVVGAGAAGSVIAAELSVSGAQVLLVESGGPDDAPTIANPSVWFYNVGGPLDYHLPVNPSPRLNNRAFNMALGHVLGGGSSINAMVWTRGMQRDYDGWAKNGAKGWAFADVLPVFKSQEDWEGGANAWRGAGGPIHIRRPKDPHPTAPAFIDAAREMGMPILDDVNGPMVPGAGYINMNVAADGTRVSAALHAWVQQTAEGGWRICECRGADRTGPSEGSASGRSRGTDHRRRFSGSEGISRWVLDCRCGNSGTCLRHSFGGFRSSRARRQAAQHDDRGSPGDERPAAHRIGAVWRDEIRA